MISATPALLLGAEQRRAVGDDQRFAFVVVQLGEGFRRQHHVFRGVEHDVAAVVVFDEAGLDVLAGHFEGRVDVGAKADGGRAFAVGGQDRADVRVFGDRHVAEAERTQLFAESFGQIVLAGRAGHAILPFGRLRVDFDVTDKTINQ